MRTALRALAEQASGTRTSDEFALGELNRVLGRSAGMRRVERRADGAYIRSFVAAGDAFAGLLLPLVESATDSLVRGELNRVRLCANPRCGRVFYDGTRNASRRWCAMGTCGNREKAAKYRKTRRREDGKTSG